MLSHALEYHAQGVAVMAIPLGSKQPAAGQRWRHWTQRPPTDAELRAMFSNGPVNIAGLCGKSSRNLLGIDCDTPVAFAEAGARLAGLGIVTPAIQRPENGSPHDGGGLWLVRTPEPVRPRKQGDLDLLGQGRYCLLPPSIHPSGGEYFFAVEAPIFELPSLDALGEWLPLETWNLGPNIPRSAWPLLRGDAQTVSRYRSRSEAEAALLAILANVGFEFPDVMRLFQTWPGPGKFAELSAENPSNALRYLQRSWYKAQQFVANNPDPVKRLARYLRRWALSRPWSGRSGSTDRAVYLAHCHLAERCARQPHGASVRELAELAGIHWNTANRANKRLIQAGLLRVVEKSTATLSRRYQLACDVPALGLRRPCLLGDKLGTLPHPNVRECTATSALMQGDKGGSQHSRECTTMSMPNGGEAGTKNCAAHDLFRWGGLNKSGAEIWERLVATEAVTAKELARMTGRCEKTVRRRLQDMLELRMVEPLGVGRWRALPDADLNGAAKALGTAGKGVEQRRLHRRDRELHRLQLDRGD